MNVAFVDLKIQYQSLKPEIDKAIQSVIDNTAFIGGRYVEAFEKAFGAELKFGALVAFVVAATPFSFAGITSAFWAVIAGFAVSALTERSEMRAYWQSAK